MKHILTKIKSNDEILDNLNKIIGIEGDDVNFINIEDIYKNDLNEMFIYSNKKILFCIKYNSELELLDLPIKFKELLFKNCIELTESKEIKIFNN